MKILMICMILANKNQKYLFRQDKVDFPINSIVFEFHPVLIVNASSRQKMHAIPIFSFGGLFRIFLSLNIITMICVEDVLSVHPEMDF